MKRNILVLSLVTVLALSACSAASNPAPSPTPAAESTAMESDTSEEDEPMASDEMLNGGDSDTLAEGYEVISTAPFTDGALDAITPAPLPKPIDYHATELSKKEVVDLNTKSGLEHSRTIYVMKLYYAYDDYAENIFDWLCENTQKLVESSYNMYQPEPRDYIYSEWRTDEDPEFVKADAKHDYRMFGYSDTAYYEKDGKVYSITTDKLDNNFRIKIETCDDWSFDDLKHLDSTDMVYPIGEEHNEE